MGGGWKELPSVTDLLTHEGDFEKPQTIPQQLEVSRIRNHVFPS